MFDAKNNYAIREQKSWVLGKLMHEIKTDLNRSICGKTFLISTILVMVTVIFSADWKMMFPEFVKDGLMMYYHSELIKQGMVSDITLLTLPIVCTLPYTSAFLDEYESGYIKVYLMRCNKTEYLKGKVIAPIISGGLCIFVGIIIANLMLCIIYTPMELLDQKVVSPFIDILGRACLYFLAGGFWASVGLLLSNITLSKYMAYASPFVIFYVLVIIQERYFKEFYVLNPKEWLEVEQFWVMGRWGVVIMLLLMIGIMLVVNFRVIERRISD